MVVAVKNKAILLGRSKQLFIIAGIAASRFIVFIQQVIAARFVEKHEFGQASLSFSIVSVLLPILTISFAELSYRHAYDTENKSDAYNRYGELLSRIIPVSVILFVAVGFILYVSGYALSYPLHNIIYIGVNFWFVQVLGSYRVVGNDFDYAQALVRYSLVSLLALYGLLRLGIGYDAVPLSAIAAFAFSLLSSNTRYAFKHVYSSVFRIKVIHYSRVLRDALLVSVTNMISQAYLYVDIFVASHFFTPMEVADLRAPSLLVTIASVLPVMYFSYFAPRIAAADDFRSVDQYYRRYLKIVFPLSLVAFLVLFFGAKALLLIIFGSKYVSAAPLMKWYALIIVINMLVRAPIGNMLALQGFYKFNLKLSFAFLIVMIALQYVLATRVGVVGIPLATLLVAVMAGGFSLNFYLRKLGSI